MTEDNRSMNGSTGRPKDSLGAFLPKGSTLSDLPDEMVEDLRTMSYTPDRSVAHRFSIQMLGFGSTGAVYKVTERHVIDGDKAVKVLLPTLVKNEVSLQQFLAEFEVFQELEHPNIVRVHEHGESEGFTYYTMEHVEGRPLKQWVTKREGHVPIHEALRVALQICDALYCAHKRTIHGDLKPQNVIVQADGTVKVLDFAVAKLMDADWMACMAKALGTTCYLPPELVTQGAEIDARADIYSLGAILYEIVTGKEPSDKVRLAASEWNRKVPVALDTLIEQMLEIDPANRPSSVNEVMRRLKKIATRKRRRIAACVAAGVILLAAAVGGYRVVTDGRGTADGLPGSGLSGTQPVRRGPSATEVSQTVTNIRTLLNETTSLVMTAADVVSIRNHAREQRSAAERLSAATLAPDIFGRATEEFDQGVQHEQAKAYEDARDAYESSLEMFVSAIEEAERIGSEIAAFEHAKQRAKVAKVYAEKQEGAAYAPERYAQAEARKLAAENQQSKMEAAALFDEAERLYLLTYVDAGDAMARSAEDGTQGEVTGEAPRPTEQSASADRASPEREELEEGQAEESVEPSLEVARTEPVVPEAVETDEDVTASRQLPRAVKIPDLRINIIRAASDNNPRPVAVVNMHKVYEGDVVGDTGVRVVRIDANEILVEYDGHRFSSTFR